MIFTLRWLWMAEGRCRKFCRPSQISSVVTAFFSVLFLSSMCAKNCVCSSCAVAGFRENTQSCSLPLSDMHLNIDFLCFTSCLSIFPLSQLKTAWRFCFMFYSILHMDSTPRYDGKIKQCIHISGMNHKSLTVLKMQRGQWLSLPCRLLFPLHVEVLVDLYRHLLQHLYL